MWDWNIQTLYTEYDNDKCLKTSKFLFFSQNVVFAFFFIRILNTNDAKNSDIDNAMYTG